MWVNGDSDQGWDEVLVWSPGVRKPQLLKKNIWWWHIFEFERCLNIICSYNSQGWGWSAPLEPRCQKSTTVLQSCHSFTDMTSTMMMRNDNVNVDDDEEWYPQLPRYLTVGNVVDKTSAHCNVLAPLQHNIWYFDNIYDIFEYMFDILTIYMISFEYMNDNLTIYTWTRFSFGVTVTLNMQILPCRPAVHTAGVVSLCL